MSTASKPRFPLLTADTIAKMPAKRRVHRLNAKAIRHGKSLGDAVGMQKMGLHLVTIKPGDHTTEYHTHYREEEFVYILAGRGLAEIGRRKVKVGPGDFIGFTAKSLPHTMSNPYPDDLVYLMGGTRETFDVSEYPRVQKRTYKFDGHRHTVDFKHVRDK